VKKKKANYRSREAENKDAARRSRVGEEDERRRDGTCTTWI
jgi:hypothetical protein